jgi:hypothetical protein
VKGNAAERRTSNQSKPPVPRLLLGPARSPCTLFDGGWWPRSADPVAELPGLVLALQGHGTPGDHGPVTHILLRASDWDSRPHRLHVEGVAGLTDTRVVRLNWFDTRPAGLLTVISADGHRVDLLSVPPHTDENGAWAAMEQAAKAGNLIPTPDILATIATPAHPDAPHRNRHSAQESGWESKGERLRDHDA